MELRSKRKNSEKPPSLYIKEVKNKGNGVFSKDFIKKGDCIVDYKGILTENEPVGNDMYVFEFVHKKKTFWIDASREDRSFGGIINDSRRKPNCKPVVETKGALPTILFWPIQDILPHEEILYSYGQGPFPWRKKVFGLKDAELSEVARHMGHELSVHKEFYRLQDDVIELAKVSKLLLAVEKGKPHKFSGLSLDDINLNALPDINEDTDENDDYAFVADHMLQKKTVYALPDINEDIDENDDYAFVADQMLQKKTVDATGCCPISATVSCPIKEQEDIVADSLQPTATKPKRQRKTLNLSDMDPDYQPVEIKKKRKWSEDEKICLQQLIHKAVVEGKPPKKVDVEKAKKGNILKNIPWLQIKHQAWALAQQKIKSGKRVFKC